MNFQQVPEDGFVACYRCGGRFEKDIRHCSNCFACTGCEIYYCPSCGNEIVITPVRQARKSDSSPC